MAFYKQINEQGGINGRKIEIIQEDTGCSEAISTEMSKQGRLPWKTQSEI